MMRRLTTPTHVFRLKNIDPAMVTKIKITYAQNGEVVLEKYASGKDISGNAIELRLTQTETGLFGSQEVVEIQARLLTTGNDVISSKIFRASVERVLDDEVLA